MEKVRENDKSASDTEETIKQTLVEELVLAVSAKGGNVLLSTGGITHAPVTLLPCPFSSGLFEFAKLIAPIYNTLTNNIARNILISNSETQEKKKQKLANDTSWLEDTLFATCKADEFTNNLMKIYKESRKLAKTSPEKYQSGSLGILRSDYMVHDDSKSDGISFKLLQVELNTIASSFGCISSVITDSHRYLFSKFPNKALSLMEGIPDEFKENHKLFHQSIPSNPILNNIISSFAEAHKLFMKQLKLKDNDRKIALLMIVLEDETNSFDQKLLEYNLYEKYNIKLIRKSLRQINEEGKYIDINGKQNILVIEENIISIAYFRAGYTPSHYPTEIEWEARKKIEFSQAIKCPSISYHLVGTKKVQQRLTDKDQLEKFLSGDECTQLRRSFAQIYSLDPEEMSEDDKKIIEECMTSSHYVLKPQREGGGNNFYGADVGKKLKTLSTEERKGYILMDRIYPKPQKVRLLNNSILREGEGVSELGMFSVVLSDENSVYENKYAGYLLRTKFEGVDEGGVATGYSNLGSVCLC